MLKQAELVTWTDENDGYHTGYIIREDEHQEVITLRDGRMLLETACYTETLILVQHSKTLALEFIRTVRLFHYYGDKEGKVGLQPHHISKPRLTDDVLAFQRGLEEKIV